MRTLLTFLALVFLLGAGCRSNKEAVCPPVVIPTDCDAFRQQLRAIDEQYVFDSLIINGGDSSYILDSLGVRGIPLKTKDFDGPFYNKTFEGCTYFVEFAPRVLVYNVSQDTLIKTYITFHTLIEGDKCTLRLTTFEKVRCTANRHYPNCSGMILYSIKALDERSNYYFVKFDSSKIRFVSKLGPVLSTFIFRKKS